MKKISIAFFTLVISFFVSYSQGANQKSVKNENNRTTSLKIVNPYKNVDFSKYVRLKGISHEHAITQAALESAYNRGIRIFAITNYQPSVPTYPLSGASYQYVDFEDAVTLNKITKTYTTMKFEDFTDREGIRVQISDLIAIPNSEAVNLTDFGHHSCYLGSMFCDVGWGVASTVTNFPKDKRVVEWRSTKKQTDYTTIINGVSNNLLFAGKVFGTLNHPRGSLNGATSAIDRSRGAIKAVEIFNGKNYFGKMYDDLLKAGYKLFCVAVVDWPGIVTGNIKSTGDRGCNVLYFDPSFDSLPMIRKQEAALDAYIKGEFYAAGYGSQYISDLTVRKNKVHLAVSGSPDSINVITNHGKEKLTNVSKTTKVIQKGISYIRFECYYSDGDFIFTNPVWFKKK